MRVLIWFRRVSSQSYHRISLNTVHGKDFILPALKYERPRVEEGLALQPIEQDVRPGERDECCVGEGDDVQPQHGPVRVEVIFEALGVLPPTYEGDKVFGATHNLWAGAGLW